VKIGHAPGSIDHRRGGRCSGDVPNILEIPARLQIKSRFYAGTMQLKLAEFNRIRSVRKLARVFR
jgi:hypothetical protein